MHGIRRVFSLLAIILAIGALTVTAGSASPGSTAEDQAIAAAPYDTVTTQEAWLRQCASLSCGYHVIPAGTRITVFCHTANVGIDWNIVVTKTTGYLAGHMDVVAINRPHEQQSCSNAGRKLFPMRTDLWLHSCPAMACGYGVSQPGHDIAGLAAGPFREGFDWYLVLDHDNVHKNLVGWVHTEDIDS